MGSAWSSGRDTVAVATSGCASTAVKSTSTGGIARSGCAGNADKASSAAAAVVSDVAGEAISGKDGSDGNLDSAVSGWFPAPSSIS